MNNELHIRDGESKDQYFYRICCMKDQLGLNWDQMAQLFNDQLQCNFGESKYRKDWVAFERIFNANKGEFFEDEQYLNKLVAAQRKLEAERKKLQTEKIEYNRLVREKARDELLDEKVIDAIHSLPKCERPRVTITPGFKRPIEAVLCIGDAHYGSKFTIKGLDGEIINAYSTEIFEQRMDLLLEEVALVVNEYNIELLRVYELGDFTDGVIRCGQLMKLECGVIEGTIRYANYMAEWLSALSELCYVEYQMTFGNHSELRLLNQKKGTFKNENTGLVVAEIIKARLANNPNFVYKDNPTGYIFDTVAGFNILGIHGETKNMEKELEKLSHMYGRNVDILVSGHLHHFYAENIGRHREVVRVPSIMGTDEYALSIRATADAGAIMMFLEPKKGKVGEYVIKF